MKKSEKLKALKSLADGKPINHVFNELNLILIKSEHETKAIGCREATIKNNEVGAFIASVRADNPFKLVTVTRLTEDEYEAIEEKLEREY